MGPLPIPLRVRTTLKFSDTYLLASTAGFAYYEYSGNSAYDPDVTGGGGQPLFFDQYAALY